MSRYWHCHAWYALSCTSLPAFVRVSVIWLRVTAAYTCILSERFISQHLYHPSCIRPWLRRSQACPSTLITHIRAAVGTTIYCSRSQHISLPYRSSVSANFRFSVSLSGSAFSACGGSWAELSAICIKQ